MLEERLAMVEVAKKSSDGAAATDETTAIPMLIENCDAQSNK